MKDIDERLKQNAPNPRRSLGAYFTSNIIEKFEAQPRKIKLRERFKEFFRMKFAHKPIAIVAAAIAIISVGGAGYAAAIYTFPGLSTHTIEQRILSNGNRVVKIDSKACDGGPVPNYAVGRTLDDMTNNIDRHRNYYYEVKKGSKLTNDQISSLVKGQCEMGLYADFSKGVVIPELAKNPANKRWGMALPGHKDCYLNTCTDGANILEGYGDSIITAISPASISFKSMMQDSSHLHQPIEPTFIVDPQVLAYDMISRVPLESLHVGDHVAFMTRWSKLYYQYNNSSDIPANEQTVIALLKTTPNMSEVYSIDWNSGELIEVNNICGDRIGGGQKHGNRTLGQCKDAKNPS